MASQKDSEHILSLVKSSVDNPLFYPRIFALVDKKKRKEKNQEPFASLIEEYELLSRRIERSQIQEGCSVRNVLRSRSLAKLLIDEKGEFNLSILPNLITFFKKHLYSLGPVRQYDGKRQEHILKVLELLNTQKDYSRLFKKFSRPISNKWVDELIRYTLSLPNHISITDAHTRQAVLAAWFCYLRQNVGSCFATAPAIIIHDEQPELFLQDLYDLISTGRLKRTFGGIENSVPLSASWGSGDLKKPIVIRQTSKDITPEIWYSPGLIAAFEAIGFLKKEDSLKDKINQLKGWILSIMKQRQSDVFTISAEEVIRKILLINLNLTEKQLTEYESRSRGMLQSQIFLHVPSQSSGQGAVGERSANFFHLFELAKNSFKSLSDIALLKAWEYTLASFSDVKYEFTRWNLYASLGLSSNEQGGIGQCIYQNIQHKLDQANRKVQDIQGEYEVVYTQVKTLESRMRHASTENEVQWLKIEYQSRANEFYFLQEKRDEAQHKASSLVNLYDNLYKIYIELFKDYFQEVYDADMQEVSVNPFDDTPAGFRLIYKHGRSNTSQWTRIKNQFDFIESLVSFFVATEPQISHLLEEKKIEKDLSDVVTAIINHIKTKEFIESAFHRMAIAHQAPSIKDPLNHLDQIEKKPWAYTSGGTMNTLVSCYYRLEDKPKEIEKWVENEMELLVYLADTIKQIPPRFMDPYLKEQRQSMLMQSPTHAFLFKPMLNPFKETWSNDEFTYTFIRDHFIRPSEIFIEQLLLNDEMIEEIIRELSEKVPENYLPRFKSVFSKIHGPLNPIFFREYLIDTLARDRGLRYHSQPILSIEEIDRYLYSTLPLFPLFELKERLSKIFSELPAFSSTKVSQILNLFDQSSLSKRERLYLGASHLQNIAKALLCLFELETTSSFDYHLYISLICQKLGLAIPRPLLFADSNWMKDMFGFVVNPGTGKLELWRVDYTGSTGYPMNSWKQWLDGSRSDLRWSVYTKPFQYGQN